MSTRRTPAKREADLETLSRLYLTGRTQAYCAKAVGISQGQISKDLVTLQSRWQDSALINVDAAKARELGKIDQMERVYWTAWRKSCRDEEIETTEASQGQKGSTTKAGKRKRGQSGNPAFMAGVQWCVTQRCKLRGMDAPIHHEHSGPGGRPIAHTHTLETLTDEQLESIARGDPADGRGTDPQTPPGAPGP